MLLEGQKIVCIDKMTPRSFTVNKTYVVEKNFYGLFIFDDTGEKDYVALFSDFFEELNEFRLKRLNNLGI